MGTNYYWEANVCAHCDRSDPPLHIGKSSVGWSFTFHGTDEIRSFADWKEVFTRAGRIRDEYGSDCPLETFIRLVECKRGGRNHARLYPDGNWLDDEGNAFCDGEFS